MGRQGRRSKGVRSSECRMQRCDKCRMQNYECRVEVHFRVRGNGGNCRLHCANLKKSNRFLRRGSKTILNSAFITLHSALRDVFQWRRCTLQRRGRGILIEPRRALSIWWRKTSPLNQCRRPRAAAKEGARGNLGSLGAFFWFVFCRGAENEHKNP